MRKKIQKFYEKKDTKSQWWKDTIQWKNDTKIPLKKRKSQWKKNTKKFNEKIF